MSADSSAARWLPRLGTYAERLAEPPPVVVEGKLTRMVGLTLEAVGCEAAIGDRWSTPRSSVSPATACS
jgi:flagellar biosynthesis/type III secretory pathway ATPase